MSKGLLSALIVGGICLNTYSTIGNEKDTVLVDSLQIHRTPEVVVSASRWQESASSVSRYIAGLTIQDIRERNPQTTADLLESTGEVFMQRSQQGGGSPRLRGFAANSVLMVIDGIRMNNAIYRSGNLHNLNSVDAFSLASSEVLFGPGSVQYGSDAMGGVLVFSTKAPITGLANALLLPGGAIRYSSGNNEATGNAELHYASQNIGSYSSITVSSFGDLRSGGNFPADNPEFGKRTWVVERFNGSDTAVANDQPLVQKYSGYDQVNALQKVRIDLGSHLHATYMGLFTTTSDIPRYDRLVETTDNGIPRSAEWYYGPQSWTLQSLTVNGKNLGSIANDFVLTVAGQWLSESRNIRRFKSPWLRSQVEHVRVLSLNADARLPLSDDELERDLYYGFELSFQDVESTGTEYNIDSMLERPAITRYPNGGTDVNMHAAYVQLRYGVIDNLMAAAGVRGTLYSLHSVIVPDNLFPYPFTSFDITTGAINASAGLSWQPTQSIVWHANVASGFRSPNVDDAAKIFDSAPGILIVPNSNLMPVDILTAETGFSYNFVANHRVSGSIFQSWLANAMEVRPSNLNGLDTVFYDGLPSAVMASVNIGEARLYGFHLSLTGVKGQVSYAVKATYFTGRDITNDIPIRHTAPAFGMVRISWTATDALTLSAENRWAGAWTPDMISPLSEASAGIQYPQGGLNGWNVSTLRASLRIPWGVILQAAVENLFDLQYRPAQSGISASGRQLVLAIRKSAM